MSTSADRTFATASDANRYADGYDRGMSDPAGSYNAYAMFDCFWGQGYRDAQRDFSKK